MTPLPTRTLGRNGPQVTALGFGTMGLSSFYGPVPSDEERFEILDYVFESGVTNWDSSDLYGDSEQLIGKWFSRTGLRDQVFLATKFGFITTPPGGIRSDPEYVKEACAKSLKRLGVEMIDLYYAHRLDMKTPIEKTVQAMVELKNQGMIKYLGLSEVSADTLHRAYKVHPIAAVQIEYSPFTMDIENPQIGLLKACRELGVAVVAYSPLGRGFLTGKYRSPDDFGAKDMRKFLPRFSPENFNKNLELVDKLDAVAKEMKISVGVLTLAWLLAQGHDIIPIPGTTKRSHFEENLKALRVQLSSQNNALIRALVNEANIFGDRYDARSMGICFADTPSLN